jgi:hypothetical protein
VGEYEADVAAEANEEQHEYDNDEDLGDDQGDMYEGYDDFSEESAPTALDVCLQQLKQN